MYRKEYLETTNRKVFNIVHISNVTSCCIICNRRIRNGYYFIISNDKKRSRYPNWKLVSKNKKQWMYNHNLRLIGNDYFVEFKW